ncbi:Xanthine dehydrogenase [Clostridium sp. DL-VIII]|uniref:xanthine dehydrogenase family protein molybdopterin-binding subunit n=1 Tax=Clostridium sp. DL-VIII TaxID=641107 RepID=UPI00023AF356|nr:xanthine dehydrogenase family protein molybdopterin-binding subunit [Clostridium sp. DL-VIII]EHI97728.1 Xanthine dehydrogenase [Clostridium sp. DL-VIII]
MEELSVVGKTIIRKDALDKVLGKTRFSADIKMYGMLYGKVLRSKIAHGFVKKIDISKAAALPGVHAVLTSKDVPGLNGHGIIFKDEPVLVSDKIRKIGDGLAVVAAESEEIANQAIKLIEVEIEEIPGVFDPVEAMKEDAPKVHGDNNILALRKIIRGNIDEAFKNADIVVENEYHTQMQEHAYLEPEAGIAYMDNDVIVIKASTQNTHFDCREIARNLAMPQSRIRMIQAPTGGGFGGKLDVSVQIYLALLALKTRRPVKIVYSREESIITSSKRHPCIIKYKTAADKTGKLSAIDVNVVADTGAYSSYGPAPITRLAVHAAGPYDVPNVKIYAYTVYTNNPTAGAMRGFGVPQIAFAYEQQMDMIAEKAGISSLEVRLRNTLKKGSMTSTGQVMNIEGDISGTLVPAYDKLMENRCKKVLAPYKKRGIGMGCLYFGIGNTGQPNPAGAFLDVMEDGSANLMVGAADMGQGSNTILAQIAAEELGIDFYDIKVISADTGVTPDGGASSASRQTYISGNAVLEAAKAVKNIFVNEVAIWHNVSPQVVTLKNKAVFINGESTDITVPQLVSRCRGKGIMTIGHGGYNPTTTALDEETGQGEPYEVYSFASQVAEVEVDTQTGQIDVLRIVAAHDVGQAVNPLQVVGQIEGGTIMGLGYGLFEEVKKSNGKIQNPSFATYVIPTAVDIPPIDSIIVEEKANTGPFGAKGLGEPPLVLPAAVIANAIYDAIGVRIHSLPITPEKVLKAIEEARKQGK